jgi:hypothetical protein
VALEWVFSNQLVLQVWFSFGFIKLLKMMTPVVTRLASWLGWQHIEMTDW